MGVMGMKKSKSLRVKQMINDNFKHLKKLPKINSSYELIDGDIYRTHSIKNGQITYEGYPGKKQTSYLDNSILGLRTVRRSEWLILVHQFEDI